MARAKSTSPSSPVRYLFSHAFASIVVETVTVLLLKWFV
jgi:hypothetical protein